MPQIVLSVVLGAFVMILIIGGGLMLALTPAAVAASLGYHLITQLPEQASHVIFTALPWTAVAGVIVTRLVAGRDRFKDIAMSAAAFYMYAALAFYGLALVGGVIFSVGMAGFELISEVPQMTLDDVLSFAGMIALCLFILVIPAAGSTL